MLKFTFKMKFLTFVVITAKYVYCLPNYFAHKIAGRPISATLGNNITWNENSNLNPKVCRHKKSWINFLILSFCYEKEVQGFKALCYINLYRMVPSNRFRTEMKTNVHYLNNFRLKRIVVTERSLWNGIKSLVERKNLTWITSTMQKVLRRGD